MPYRCPICFREFQRQGNQTAHTRTAHQEQLLRAFQEHNHDVQQRNGAAEEIQEVNADANNAHETDMEDEGSQARIEYFVKAGEPVTGVPDRILTVNDVLYPFETSFEYNVASWMIRSRIPKKQIDAFFSIGFSTADISSFKSAYTLWKKIDVMAQDLELEFVAKEVDFGVPGRPPAQCFFRDPIKCIQYLLKQPVFAERLVYAPCREFNSAGERIYTEMHTANYWWREQETLPEGATLIPIICASDATHLTNFSGDKKAWPVYLTIGNLPSDVRNAPSYHAMVIVALLPIPPKKKMLSAAEKLRISSIVQEVLLDVLEPLNQFAETGIDLTCSDGYIRRCFPRLSSWIADHMEYAELFDISTKSCPRCECAVEQLGDYAPQTQIRNYQQYDQWKEQLEGTVNRVERKALLKKLKENKTGPSRIAICQLLNVRYELLPKADLLHGLYLGTLKHLLGWVTDFLRSEKRMGQFDTAWCSLPPYPRFYPFKLSFSQITQWTGKELRQAGRVLNGLVAVALRMPTAAQRQKWVKVQTCVRSFTDFHLMAQYKSHDSETMALMEQYWQQFHDTKDVFEQFRNVGLKKKVHQSYEKKYAAFERSQDVQRSSLAVRRRKLTAEKRRLDQEKHAKLQVLNGFRFPKMHQPSHYTEQIPDFGNLQGLSGEGLETSHHPQLKKGYTASNRMSYNQQMLSYYLRRVVFDMRELNMVYFATKSAENLQQIQSAVPRLLAARDNQIEEIDIIESDSDSSDSDQEISSPSHVNRCAFKSAQQLPAALRQLLTSHTVGTRLFRGPRRKYGSSRQLWSIGEMQLRFQLPDLHKHLAAYIRGKWVQLSRQQRHHAVQWPTLDNTQEVVQSFTCQPYNQLAIYVADFTTPECSIVHPVRCTGTFNWRGGPPRNDFVFIDRSDRGRFGALNGRSTARVRALFSVNDPFAGETYKVVYIQEMGIDRGGRVDPVHGFVRVYVRQPVSAVQQQQGTGSAPDPHYTIIDNDKVLALAHLIPEGADSHWYLVNTHIDLGVYNDIYEFD